MVEFSFVSFQGKETKVGPLLGLDTYITGGKLQFEVNLIKNKEKQNTTQCYTYF